ncbi:VOC family protein [Crossiella cryophila]|uniref:Putative lactoylglutathione lyase n=1 Tax=Crossiella cryophila TaxID=43355 RepID=A0A7W7FX67_9PSEU|nr:VOC family protein [Crossiella cryophila]MBB4681007.1 putative lactoylglutathione lyase [Crossiella cryophila]
MRMIFINLPVKDVAAARDFYTKLGFTANEQFSDETAVSMMVEQNITVILLGEDKFKDFIKGEIADPDTTEVLNCLSADSRAEVDELVAAALAAGGQEWKPFQDHGFMYGGSFRDLDGHVWEVMHMDPAAVAQG